MYTTCVMAVKHTVRCTVWDRSVLLQWDVCDGNVPCTPSDNADHEEQVFVFALSELNSSFFPADLPEHKETDDTHGGNTMEKYVGPASPPQSPSASDDEDFKSSSEWVKECVTSDSSADECPTMPLTPQSHNFFNLQPLEECHNSTNTERWVRYRNTAVLKLNHTCC